MTLLIIDAQTLITTPDLYAFDRFVSNVQTLIQTARENGVEVIFVQHDDGVGQPLTRGTDGFAVYEAFSPQPGERIFNKTVNSPFKDTGLLEYLLSKSETELIVAGLQTDYCIDATVKCGFEHGFHMIVPAYANSTFDNTYMDAETSYRYYNEFLWKDRYAACISMEEVLRRMTLKQ